MRRNVYLLQNLLKLIYIIQLQKIRKYFPLEELIFPNLMLLEMFEKL